MKTGKKILLIDDHDSVLKLLDAILKVRNYEVCYASSGPEGLEKARNEKPDLVLLDVMMPGMDGFKVCQALKQSEVTSHIPVVFLTARGEDTDREMGQRVGGQGFIKKPFRSVDLMETISNLLA
ncbi:MAG: two-component system response regulator [Desulfuromonas sp.]|nr:MAG: two-component system response regulator [Desulfuromonas sp.]